MPYSPPIRRVVPFPVASLFTLLLFLVAAPILSAQPIREFVGASSLDPEVRSDAEEMISTDSSLTLVRSWYSGYGYFDLRIDSGADNRFLVTEGARYVVDTVLISGYNDQTSPLPELPVRGTPFSDSLVGSVASTILDELERTGFALGTVAVVGLEPSRDEGSVTVRLQVRTGDRITIASFEFVGGGTTSESFLRRVAGEGVGSLYSPEVINRARTRLYRTGLFEPVPFPEIRLLDSASVALVFSLTPRPVNSFDGAIGYQPSTEVESGGFFTGSVDVSLRNVFGGGERIAGSWAKLDESSSDLSLSFAQPYLFGLPFGIDLAFSQIVEDETGAYTSYVDRRIRGLATANIGGEWRLEAGGEMTSLIASPDSVEGPCSDRQLPGSTTLSALFGIRYDSRDFPLNPRSGTLYGSTFSLGTRTVEGRPIECDSSGAGDRSFGRQSIHAELFRAQSLGGPFVGVGHLQGRILTGESPDFSELFRFGGIHSVRGYREGAFRGTRSGSMSVEGRLILSELSHVGLFVDGGYIFRPQLRGEEGAAGEDLLLGYGLTFQVDTPAGVARFSVGLAEGAPVDDATISVGLVGAF